MRPSIPWTLPDEPLLSFELYFPLSTAKVKWAIAMMERLIGACLLFAERKCPQQRQVEKLCLFPQISAIEDIEKICRSQCCTKEGLCSDNAERIITSLRHSWYLTPSRVSNGVAAYISLIPITELGKASRYDPIRSGIYPHWSSDTLLVRAAYQWPELDCPQHSVPK